MHLNSLSIADKLISTICFLLLFGCIENKNSKQAKSDEINWKDSISKVDFTKQENLGVYKTIAVDYAKDYTPEKANLLIDVYLKLWDTYMVVYSDNKSALSCLNYARDVAEKAGISDSRIELDYGLTYEAMAYHTNEAELFDKACMHIENSIQNAIRWQQYKTLDNAFRNLYGLLFRKHQSLTKLDQYWKLYLSLNDSLIDSKSREYTKLLRDGLIYTQKRDFKNSIMTFKKQIEETDTIHNRWLFNSYTYLSGAYAQVGNLDSAIITMQKTRDFVNGEKSLDIKAARSKVLHYYHKLAGHPQESERYYLQYSQVRDSLLAYSQMVGIKDSEMVDEMRQIDKEISKLKYERKIRDIYLWAACVIILLSIIVIVVVRHKNRKLKILYNNLYEKNIELIKVEDKAKQERKKYKTRNLSDESKDEIMEAIINIAESDERIFNLGYSIKDLSDSLNLRTEYVSQVINEKTGKGFNDFLNSYRIREACRRISNSEKYGDLTLAAIAEGVGIKSSTTFVKFFKSVTGMTPSEFRKRSDSHGKNYI